MRRPRLASLPTRPEEVAQLAHERMMRSLMAAHAGSPEVDFHGALRAWEQPMTPTHKPSGLQPHRR